MAAKKSARKAPAKKTVKKAAKKTAKKTAKKAVRKVAKKATAKTTRNRRDVTPSLVEVARRLDDQPEGSANAIILRAANQDVCSNSGRARVKQQNQTGGRVNRQHVLNRTEAMLFCTHGLVDLNPSSPLPLTPDERADLRGPINGAWFDDVRCSITREELRAAGTLSALVTAIYDACALTI